MNLRQLDKLLNGKLVQWLYDQHIDMEVICWILVTLLDGRDKLENK